MSEDDDCGACYHPWAQHDHANGCLVDWMHNVHGEALRWGCQCLLVHVVKSSRNNKPITVKM